MASASSVVWPWVWVLENPYAYQRGTLDKVENIVSSRASTHWSLIALLTASQPLLWPPTPPYSMIQNILEANIKNRLQVPSECSSVKFHYTLDTHAFRPASPRNRRWMWARITSCFPHSSHYFSLRWFPNHLHHCCWTWISLNPVGNVFRRIEHFPCVSPCVVLFCNSSFTQISFQCQSWPSHITLTLNSVLKVRLIMTLLRPRSPWVNPCKNPKFKMRHGFKETWVWPGWIRAFHFVAADCQAMRRTVMEAGVGAGSLAGGGWAFPNGIVSSAPALSSC